MIASACSKCGKPVGPELFRCEERFRSGCPFEVKVLRTATGAWGCLLAMGAGVLAVGAWLALLLARGLHPEHPLATAAQGAFTAFVLLLGFLLLVGGLYGPLGRVHVALDAKGGTAFVEGRLFGAAVERTTLVARAPIELPARKGALPASVAVLRPDDATELSRIAAEAVQAARVRDPLARSEYEKKGREISADAPPLVATVLLSLAVAGRIALRRVERETVWPFRRKSERKTGVHIGPGSRALDADGVLERRLLSALAHVQPAPDEPFGPSVRRLVEALFPSLVGNPGRELLLDARRDARARGLVREMKGRDVPHPPLLEEGLMVRIAAWIEDRLTFWVEELGAAESLRPEREELAALREAVQKADPTLLSEIAEEVRAGLAARESSD
ncbi:MAG TPA: hypothetical protein PLB02_09100 [Thermoanaerobaculia bacterium]|nr:hypothetical protein [Thermoanaerobaculia bacterium]HQR67538.1 hypothetical protein [Thermoanaerobaculia bacterium]